MLIKKIMIYPIILAIFFSIQGFATDIVTPISEESMQKLAHDPLGYVIEPLQDLFDDILSVNIEDKAELITKIKTMVTDLPYTNRLKRKLEQGLLKLLEMSDSQKKKLEEVVSELKAYPIVYSRLTSVLDIFDLANLLGIYLDESILSTPEIQEYQRKYFPISGGSVDNLQEVTENNYHLYNTWYLRFLENKNNGIQDISIPEAKAVFDYLAACFALYKQMFENPVFQEFLRIRENAKDNDVQRSYYLKNYIQSRFDNLQNLTETSKKYSYFELREIDILWRNLIDVTFSGYDRVYGSSDLVYDYVHKGSYKDLENSDFIELFREGYFFLPAIGELNNTAFALNYGVPFLQFYDITLGIVGFDGNLFINLILRKYHDIGHSLRMKNNMIISQLEDYYHPNNRKWIKIAFMRFLELCKKISHQEYTEMVSGMVYLIHETESRYCIICPGFITAVLRMIPIGMSIHEDRSLITLKRSEWLQENWQKVWEHFPLKIEEWRMVHAPEK